MRKFYMGTFALACTLLAACASRIDLSSDYNPDVDFSSFKTYQWHEGNEYNNASKTYLKNDILDQRIRQDIDQTLQAKGFRKIESGDPDFLVNYSISTEPRMDIDTYNTYGGFAPGWRYGGLYGAGVYYGGVGVGVNAVDSETRVNYYQQGTFVIDMVEPRQQLLIWRGTAEGRIPERLSNQERREAAREVVDQILEPFPPK